MGTKVRGYFEHGDFSCEGVDEARPLGDDRKTIFAPNSPRQELTREAAAVLPEDDAQGRSLL